MDGHRKGMPHSGSLQHLKCNDGVKAHLPWHKANLHPTQMLFDVIRLWRTTTPPNVTKSSGIEFIFSMYFPFARIELQGTVNLHEYKFKVFWTLHTSLPWYKGQLSNNQINSRLLVHKISELMRAKYICIMTHSSITQFIMLGCYQMSAEGKKVL